LHRMTRSQRSRSSLHRHLPILAPSALNLTSISIPQF
jgi:hypothetical protein